MLEGLMRRMANAMMDSMARRIFQDPYTENVFSSVAVAQKLGVRNIVEGCLRAESGRPISRPLGSPVVKSPWDQLLLQPVHLAPRLPTPDGVGIATHTVIGPQAARPLQLEIPILITGMSWGGALSLKAKVALAKGATLAGTATNTGEAPVLPAEREAAGLLIGQFNRGGWLNDDEQLRQVDAIEIQLGQGAQCAAPMSSSSHQFGEEYRAAFKLNKGENAVIHSRLPGVDSPREFIRLVHRLRRRYEVPVGLKLAAGHHLEQELQVALDAGVDFVTVDGAEGGTHGGPLILQDDFGIPTLFGVARAADFLQQQGATGRVSLIATGGLANPGHFLKAMALGANAVYIGSMALISMEQAQVVKALPFETPPQLVLHKGKFTEDLEVEPAAQHLAKFLKSCVDEMALGCYALGYSALTQVSRADLCSQDPHLARALRIDWVGLPPGRQLVPAWETPPEHPRRPERGEPRPHPQVH